MAVNTCNNYLKKRHIEQIELTDNFTTDLDTSLIDEILHDERKETVQKALDLLPEIQREVISREKPFANAKQVDPVLEDLYLFYFREGE